MFEAEKFRIVEEFAFDQEEMSYGSGHRELQAVIKTLEKHKERIAIDGQLSTGYQIKKMFTIF